MGQRTYSTLFRAAGIDNPVDQDLASQISPDLPAPPLPEKGNLKVDLSFLQPRQGSQPTQIRSASPHTGTSTRLFDSTRSTSPATPLSASPSFFRSRAGSSASKAPPPPLTISPAKRKGSLPTLDLRPPPVLGGPADPRLRSSSLPFNSLDPGLHTKRSAENVVNKVTEAPELAPPARPFNPRAATATPQEELLSVYEVSNRDRTVSQPESPPATATTNARASSILSISQDTAKKRLDVLAKMLTQKQVLPVAPSSTPADPESKQAYRDSAYSTASRSEAHSVPHDAVAVPQTPVHLAAPLATGNTDRSFDLRSLPFAAGANQSQAVQPMHPGLASLHAEASTSVPARQASSSSRKGKEAARKPSSTRSSRSRRSAARKSALATSATVAETAERIEGHGMSDVQLRNMPRRPSASVLHLLEPEPTPRDFPWKSMKVSEAKKTCTPQQLQKLVLDSMREYSSSSSSQPGLLLEGFESIPLELEQCSQRLAELEAMLTTELVGRGALLVKHVACLKGFNGEQGARFGEGLVTAISRSDRLAQEARMLREHVGKVEHIRDGHWRATAALSLSRLNASYLKAKDKCAAQTKEIEALKTERNGLAEEVALLRARIETTPTVEVESELELPKRDSALTMPTSAVFSGTPTPATSSFDYSSFPAPPATLQPQLKKTDLDKVKKYSNAFLSPPVSRSNTRTRDVERSPPTSPAPQTPSSASHYSPHADSVHCAQTSASIAAAGESLIPVPASPDPVSKPSTPSLTEYRFPHSLRAPDYLQLQTNPAVCPPEWAYCALPTPPLSVTEGSIDLRSPSPAPSSASSRIRAFTGRFFGSSAASADSRSAGSQTILGMRSQSTPPLEGSALPWVRGKPTAGPVAGGQVSVPNRSMSTPELDPHANALHNDREGIETLRFVPPSMHLAGAVDNEEILSLRSGSLPSPAPLTSRHRNVKRHGRMYSDATDTEGGSFDRASLFALEKLEIGSLLSEAASARASPVSDGERSRSGTPSSIRSITNDFKRFAT